MNKQENSADQPLLQRIAAARTPEGTLPPGFALPKEKTPNRLVFADGALDGIKLYHTEIKPVPITELTEALQQLCHGQQQEGARRIDAFLKQHAMIEVIDDLQKWIAAHRSQLDPGALSRYAIGCLMTSSLPEMVKLGLALMEMMNTDGQPQLKQIVRTLALSDELTLFCLFVMRNWSHANDEMFDLVQKVRGWGRIHCVAQIEPENRLIRKWLLDYGCENTVAAAYSALPVAEKAELAEQLAKEDISDQDWQGINRIVDGLMAEGPVAGISSYSKKEELLERYPQQAARRQTRTLTEVRNLIAIMQYIQREKKEYPALKQKLTELLQSSASYLAVSEAMEQGNGFEEAVKLGIPYAQKAMDWLKQDPIEHCMTVRWLMLSEPDVDAILAIFRQALPLSQMASGPSDVLGLGKEYQSYHALAALVQALAAYPGQGTEFLQCALLCPVVSCRTHALNTLEGWVNLSAAPLKGIAPQLMPVLAQAEVLEVKEELRNRILRLKEKEA